MCTPGSGLDVGVGVLWSQMTAFCLSSSAMYFLGCCSYSHIYCSFSSASICALSIRSAEYVIHCYLCVFCAQQIKVFEVSGKYVFTNAILHEQELNLLMKTGCIPEPSTSRGNSLTGIPSPAGSSGKSLFHHS